MNNDEIRKRWETIIPPDKIEKSSAFETYRAAKIAAHRATTYLSVVSIFDDKSAKGAPPMPSSFLVDSQALTTQESSNDSYTDTAAHDNRTKSKRVAASQYEIIEEIAQGGMGIVYRGRQKSLQRDIAIKKIKTATNDLKTREKFISESLVAAYLEHPNIIPVHELGEGDDGEVVLAMKLVEGTEWKDLLHPTNEKHRQLAANYDLETHLEILIDVCNAISYAHSKDIVHNDLKPSNIMVGKFGEVLVMDWGIAVDIGEKGHLETRTWHKTEIVNPMGTPGYMAKELAEGNGAQIGPWTDVYLLGAILHEILTGNPPHVGTNAFMALISAVRGELPEFSDEVPQELQEICRKALQKEPRKRYQSVAALQKEIQEFLRHRESLLITSKAQEVFDQGKQNRASDDPTQRTFVYGQFSQAISGFQQALQLWDRNDKAQRGQHLARLALTHLAIENEDIGLAESQVAELEDTEAKKDLCQQINSLKQRNIRERRTSQVIRRCLAAAIITIIVGLFAGIIAISDAHTRLAERKKYSEKKRDMALRRLAKILLHKASQAYDKGQWDECGAYAGRALEFIQDIDAVGLKENGKSLVRLALTKRSLVWKTPLLYHEIVYCLAINPNGTLLASGAEDKMIRLWDIATGNQIKVLTGHEGAIRSLAFHPRGEILASASTDGTLRLWDIKSGEQQRVIKGHTKTILALAFNVDGSLLASSSYDKSIKLWRTDNAEFSQEMAIHEASPAMSFLNDGITLAVGDKDEIVLWNTTTGAKNRIKAAAGIQKIALSPKNGSILASAHSDGPVRLWDITTGKQIHQLAANSQRLSSIAFNSQGNILASVSQSDKTIQLWDVDKGTLLKTLSGHSLGIFCVVFHPQQNWLISSSLDRSIRFWDIDNKEPERVAPGHRHTINAVAYSPDGRTFASACEDSLVRLWRDQHFVLALSGHTGPIYDVAFSPDNKYLASASKDTTVRLWEIASGTLLRSYTGHQAAVNSIAFSPDGALLTSAADDGTTRIWDTTSGDLRKILTRSSPITAVAFSPDGEFLATGSKNSIVRLWSVQSGAELKYFSEPQSGGIINTVAFSPDGVKIIASYVDKKAIIWDISEGTSHSLEHDSAVRAATYSPDGRLIASLSIKEIKLWDAATKNLIGQLDSGASWGTALAFHPSSKILLSSEEYVVKLWHLHIPIARPLDMQPAFSIEHLTSDGRGELLAAVCHKKIVQVWNIDSGEQQGRFSFSQPLRAISFLPNSSALLCIEKNGTVHLCSLESKESKQLAIQIEKGPTAFTTDGKILAFSEGEALVLWDMEQQKKHTALQGYANPSDISFRSNNRHLLIHKAKKIVLWDIIDSQVILEDSDSFRCLFSPDGKMLASVANSKIIKLTELETGKTQLLPGHSAPIWGLAFSPDSRRIASTSADRTVRVWDVASGEQIASYNTILWNYSITFCPDRKSLVSISSRIATVWDIDTGKKAEEMQFAPESKLFLSPSGKYMAMFKQKILIFPLDSATLFPSFSKNFAFLEKELAERPQQITEALFEQKVDETFSNEKVPLYSIWK